MKASSLPLTKCQRRILGIVGAFIEEHGHSPSYEEIGRQAKLSSLATVGKHIKALTEKGYIRHNFNSYRDIEVVPEELRGWQLCSKGHEPIYHRSLACPMCGPLLASSLCSEGGGKVKGLRHSTSGEPSSTCANLWKQAEK